VDVEFSGPLAGWLSARQVAQVFCNATFVDPPRGAGWYPDPLLPLYETFNASPTRGKRHSIVEILPGQSQALWLTLSVPRNTTPGRYNGVVVIRCKNGSVPVEEITINTTVLVWNITLPALAESQFTSFFQFQYQHHPFGADRPGNVRGDLLPYYGQKRLRDIELGFFDSLCASRIPPIGYMWRRSVSDIWAALRSDVCTGINGDESKPDSGHSLATDQPWGQRVAQIASTFSIMDISILFGHKSGTPYNASYKEMLWQVLDPIVTQLNETGLLEQAAVYGFDEAHPKALYEPIIRDLFGAVKSRYRGQLRTIACLHFCPSLSEGNAVDDIVPIDILVHSYADWPNGTDAAAHYGKPGQPGEFCEAGFPVKWNAEADSREYWFYHCFSPRGAHDDVLPATPHYGAMNTYVNYPRIHNRLMPWWAAANEGVSGWLYFEVSEWRFDTEPNPRVVLPAFVAQPNTGFVDERLDGTSARLGFNVNKYYGNVYGGGTTSGDGIFLYPGREGPLVGARVETWRDGSEDHELFAQLPMEQRQRLVHQLVSGLASWSDDPELLESVRREAAAYVMAALSQPPPG
jgi:hypothetical protein